MRDHNDYDAHEISVAHGAGICREAYDAGREVTDAHIVTALKRIFPNATFVDKYRY